MINKLENTNKTLALANGSQEHPTYAYVTEDEKEVKTAKEIYYHWLSRLVILLTILSLLFFCAASLVLFKLAPQVTVEPFLLIEQDQSEEMVRYEPIAPDMPSSRQIMETFIKQYIIVRNSVINDEREMQSRWYGGGIVNYLSSPQIFNEFYTKEVEKNFFNILQSGAVRDVEIISINKAGGENSRVWTVKFNTYELNPNYRNEISGAMRLITRYWTASISAIFVPERMFLSRRLMNPLGFTVVQYSQSEAKIL